MMLPPHTGLASRSKLSFQLAVMWGAGHFRGNEISIPNIGEPGRHEAVEEERIEVVVPREILQTVIESLRSVHPYEEVAIDVYPLEDL